MAHVGSAAEQGEQIDLVDAAIRSVRASVARRVPAGANLKGVWAGYGNGHVCDGCGELIGRQDVEYELEFRLEESTTIVKLHHRCWHDCETEGQKWKG